MMVSSYSLIMGLKISHLLVWGGLEFTDILLKLWGTVSVVCTAQRLVSPLFIAVAQEEARCFPEE